MNPKELRLLSFKFPHPIQRIYGGDVVVCVECEFEVGKERITVQGLGFSEDIQSKSILKARQDAIDDCHFWAMNLSGVSVRPERVVRRELLRQLVRKSIGVELEKRTEIAKNKGREDLIDKLYGPATSAQQKAIERCCEELGIEPIDVLSDPSFSLLESYGLLTEFERKIADNLKVPFDVSRLGT